MSTFKGGTVKGGSELVKSAKESVRAHAFGNQVSLVPNVLRAGLEDVETGYSSIVRGYGVGSDSVAITSDLWPGISGGVLTVNDATVSHKVVMSGDVLTIDDGAASSDFAILNPDEALLVDQ